MGHSLGLTQMKQEYDFCAEEMSMETYVLQAGIVLYPSIKFFLISPFRFNIRYFYEHKENATIYVKIIDSILENKEEEKLFFQLFGDICDTIYIEHLVIMEHYNTIGQTMCQKGGI